MPAFVIVDVELRAASDADEFAAYVADSKQMLQEAGARTVVEEHTPLVLEGDWKPRTVVVHEFPSMDALQRFYASPAYAPLRRLRQRLSHANIVAVHGLATGSPLAG